MPLLQVKWCGVSGMKMRKVCCSVCLPLTPMPEPWPVPWTPFTWLQRKEKWLEKPALNGLEAMKCSCLKNCTLFEKN